MSKYTSYRQRLKEDPEKLSEYRKKSAERQRRWRKRNATVTPPCNATHPDRNATRNATSDPYSFKAIKEREESIRESCSEDYQQIMESSFFDGTSGSGGLHSPSENQGRSFSGDESCLRTPEAIEREWHSIWGVTDGH